MAKEFGTFMAFFSIKDQPEKLPLAMEVIGGNLAYFTPMKTQEISVIISQLKTRAKAFRKASIRKLLKHFIPRKRKKEPLQNFIPRKLKKEPYCYKHSVHGEFILFAGQDRV